MSSDAEAPRPVPLPAVSYSYDSDARLSELHEVAPSEGSIYRHYALGPAPQNPAFEFTHDKDKGLFILTWSDGRVERFRDRPARQLMVEPDRETGAMRPVYVYLCREEREQV